MPERVKISLTLVVGSLDANGEPTSSAEVASVLDDIAGQLGNEDQNDE